MENKKTPYHYASTKTYPNAKVGDILHASSGAPGFGRTENKVTEIKGNEIWAIEIFNNIQIMDPDDCY
ncbi:MAG: hypothetical protein CL596_05220 [Alteromonas sp.]|nr:hypothetical protein [Alteromonas sp.]|tara:strand:- start:462 stop:665 length:204 start_codon:yes stop_codon:yes gene_type:complete